MEISSSWPKFGGFGAILIPIFWISFWMCSFSRSKSFWFCNTNVIQISKKVISTLNCHHTSCNKWENLPLHSHFSCNKWKKIFPHTNFFWSACCLFGSSDGKYLEKIGRIRMLLHNLYQPIAGFMARSVAVLGVYRMTSNFGYTRKNEWKRSF